ncbi:MAG: hypothetical protein ACTMIK_11245 [Galactobacter sp.]
MSTHLVRYWGHKTRAFTWVNVTTHPDGAEQYTTLATAEPTHLFVTLAGQHLHAEATRIWDHIRNGRDAECEAHATHRLRNGWATRPRFEAL